MEIFQIWKLRVDNFQVMCGYDYAERVRFLVNPCFKMTRLCSSCCQQPSLIINRNEIRFSSGFQLPRINWQTEIRGRGSPNQHLKRTKRRTATEKLTAIGSFGFAGVAASGADCAFFSVSQLLFAATRATFLQTLIYRGTTDASKNCTICSRDQFCRLPPEGCYICLLKYILAHQEPSHETETTNERQLCSLLLAPLSCFRCSSCVSQPLNEYMASESHSCKATSYIPS